MSKKTQSNIKLSDDSEGSDKSYEVETIVNQRIVSNFYYYF